VTVYGEKQVAGYKRKGIQRLDNSDRILRAERFYRRIRAEVLHGHRQADYEADGDRILVQNFERFHQVESYYSTLAHEHVHWTKSRVERCDKFGVVRKNVPTKLSYAFEELLQNLGPHSFATGSALRRNRGRIMRRFSTHGWPSFETTNSSFGMPPEKHRKLRTIFSAKAASSRCRGGSRRPERSEKPPRSLTGKTKNKSV
jgi:hypothetical protein